MARDAALITTWSTPARGREAKALEVFMELMGFWGRQAAAGKCEEPQVFFATDGSHGVFVVKGRSDALMEIQESDEGQELFAKGHMIVQDLKSHWYFTGDTEVQRGTQILVQAGTALGFM